MKKKNIILIIIIIIILILLISSIIYLYQNEDRIKLKYIGYNNIETKEILTLSDSEIDKIKNYEYNENIIYIIKSDNYNKK